MEKDGIMEELKSMVREGVVSNVDSEKMTATVKYTQQEIMSTELKLMQNNASGSWIPVPGQHVLCLLFPGGDGDGVILGGI